MQYCVRDRHGRIDAECGFVEFEGLAVWHWHRLRRAAPAAGWRVVAVSAPSVGGVRRARVLGAVAPAPSLGSSSSAPAPSLGAGGGGLGSDLRAARRADYSKYTKICSLWGSF